MFRGDKDETRQVVFTLRASLQEVSENKCIYPGEARQQCAIVTRKEGINIIYCTSGF